MAVLTQFSTKLNLYQPGRDRLRKILSNTSLSQGQLNSILDDLDYHNYFFAATNIANHSLDNKAGENLTQKAHNFGRLLLEALDLNQAERGLVSDAIPTAKEAVEKTFSQPEVAEKVFSEFIKEYPNEQNSDPSNYQSANGGSNPFIDHLEKSGKEEIQKIMKNWHSSPLGQEVDAYIASEPVITTTAEAGSITVPAATAATVISGAVSTTTPSTSSALAVGSRVPVAPTVTVIEAVPSGNITAFSMSPDMASRVIGREYLNFGIFERVPASNVPGISIPSGSDYYQLTAKAARFKDLPGMQGTIKYISQTPGVTTYTSAGIETTAQTMSKPIAQAGVKAASQAGTKVAAQVATKAATTAITASGGAEAGAAAGAAAGSPGGPVAIITAIIGAIVGFIASELIPYVVDLAKKILISMKEQLTAMTVGVLAFFMAQFSGVAFMPAALIGAGVGAITKSVSSGDLSQRISNFSNSFIGITIGVLLTPIFVGVFGTAVLIIFFSYIITTSSYVVPYNPYDITQNVGTSGSGAGPEEYTGIGTFPPGTTPSFPSNPFPPPGSRPPPGPGSDYPHCWPIRNTTITQDPDCEDGRPEESHCCWVVNGTCQTPGEATWNAFDLRAYMGQPVMATHDGQLCYYPNKDGWGNLAIVKSRFGFSTYYAHLLSFTFNPAYCEEGATCCIQELVTAGTEIGYADDTGSSSGSHLHYGITGGSLIRDVIPPEDADISRLQVPTGCVADAPPPTVCQWPNYCRPTVVGSCDPGDVSSFILTCSSDGSVPCCVKATPTPRPSQSCCVGPTFCNSMTYSSCINDTSCVWTCAVP